MDNSKNDELIRTIVKIARERKPKSVRELAVIAKGQLQMNEEEIIKVVLKLQAEEIIKLEKTSQKSKSLMGYLGTGNATWYWATIAIAFSTIIMIFIISEDLYPWIYLRNVFGLIFTLFLPGYAFVKLTIPNRKPTEVFPRRRGTVERVVLSVGVSLALVPIIGLILYYTPIGLETDTIGLSLLIFTLVLASAAVAREYGNQ